jgi:hypothetical protein
MNIYFVANALAKSGRKVAKQLHRSIDVSLPTDLYAVSTVIFNNIDSLESLLYEITQITNNDQDTKNVIFTGSSITTYIKELYNQFPNAGYYLIKAKEQLSDGYIENMVLRRGGSFAAILDFHITHTELLNEFVKELGLEWQLLNRPFFLNNTNPNCIAIDGRNDSDIFLATINV